MPLKVTISAGLLNLPQRIDRCVKIARNGSQQLATTIIKQEIRSVGAVASQELVNSVRTLKNTADTDTVGSNVKQAYFIEFGRKPGPVPRWRIFKPILRKWANFKGLALSDSVLYLIGQKIKREGYKARQPFHKAANILLPKVGRLWRSVFRGL